MLGMIAKLMQGNEAIAEGAFYAGARFYAGYPITPSSEVAEVCSRRLPILGGMYMQMEDEIASMGGDYRRFFSGKKILYCNQWARIFPNAGKFRCSDNGGSALRGGKRAAFRSQHRFGDQTGTIGFYANTLGSPRGSNDYRTLSFFGSRMLRAHRTGVQSGGTVPDSGDCSAQMKLLDI